VRTIARAGTAVLLIELNPRRALGVARLSPARPAGRVP
jgi:hypothetical protein